MGEVVARIVTCSDCGKNFTVIPTPLISKVDLHLCEVCTDLALQFLELKPKKDLVNIKD